MKKQFVSFIGAGPGDPGLLTCKGLERIKQADVILYDNLINPLLLLHANDSCVFINCGKKPYMNTITQDEIATLLIESASTYSLVVRLKGGDPSIFGRIGEEINAINEANIPFEVIPGITSGSAAPMYSGIPLTFRKEARSVAFLTARDCLSEDVPPFHFEHLSSIDTIIFYMGVAQLEKLIDKLLPIKSTSTPIAIIQWGTYGAQQTISGTLDTILEMKEKQPISNPAIIIIGDVVKHHSEGNWFEQKSLHGKTFFLADSVHSTIYEQLVDQGANMIPLPHRKKGQWDQRFHTIWKEYIHRFPLDGLFLPTYKSYELALDFFQWIDELDLFYQTPSIYHHRTQELTPSSFKKGAMA